MMSDTANDFGGIKELLQKNKSRIGLTILLIYVFLLGLGTIGELWDI